MKKVIVYTQEQRYESDNDVTPVGFIFDSVEEAHRCLKNIGYKKIKSNTHPANQMDRWVLNDYHSEIEAIVFEASTFQYFSDNQGEEEKEFIRTKGSRQQARDC